MEVWAKKYQNYADNNNQSIKGLKKNSYFKKQENHLASENL